MELLFSPRCSLGSSGSVAHTGRGEPCKWLSRRPELKLERKQALATSILALTPALAPAGPPCGVLLQARTAAAPLLGLGDPANQQNTGQKEGRARFSSCWQVVTWKAILGRQSRKPLVWMPQLLKHSSNCQYSILLQLEIGSLGLRI